jgi:pyruvate/2-oxoacid:ferredoxin oxidoreductase beta subunit
VAVNDFICERFFPHIWCQGCGHGIVIYGMTGGQYSPLSGSGTLATTAPYLNIDRGVQPWSDAELCFRVPAARD